MVSIYDTFFFCFYSCYCVGQYFYFVVCVRGSLIFNCWGRVLNLYLDLEEHNLFSEQNLINSYSLL